MVIEKRSKVMAETEYIKIWKEAGALLANSPLTRLIGNIFLTINKPKVPTKIFSDYVDALT